MMIKNNYEKDIKINQAEVRNLVFQGIEQARQGKTKDFEGVCERLEKKYSDEEI